MTRWRWGFLAVAVLAVCAAGAWRLRPGLDAPTLHVGECVGIPATERWEHDVVIRIEQVGVVNYLVRVTPANVWRDVTGYSLPFAGVEQFPRVDCPQTDRRAR